MLESPVLDILSEESADHVPASDEGRTEAMDPVRQLIYRRMNELGIRGRSLSKRIGKSQSYMNQFLGRMRPLHLPDDVVESLARVLEVEPWQLLPNRRPPAGTPNLAAQLSTATVPLIRLGNGLSALPTAHIAPVAALGGDPSAFAVMMNADMGGLRRGDIVFCRRDLPVRAGDRVAVIVNDRVEGLGEVVSQNAGGALVKDLHYGDGEDVPGAVLAKVVALEVG